VAAPSSDRSQRSGTTKAKNFLSSSFLDPFRVYQGHGLRNPSAFPLKAESGCLRDRPQQQARSGTSSPGFVEPDATHGDGGRESPVLDLSIGIPLIPISRSQRLAIFCVSDPITVSCKGSRGGMSALGGARIFSFPTRFPGLRWTGLPLLEIP